MVNKAKALITSVGLRRFVQVAASSFVTRLSVFAVTILRPFGVAPRSWALRILKRQSSDRASLEIFDFWLPRILLLKEPQVIWLPAYMKKAFSYLIPFIHPKSKILSPQDKIGAGDRPTWVLLNRAMARQFSAALKEFLPELAPAYSNSTFVLLVRSDEISKKLSSESQAVLKWLEELAHQSATSEAEAIVEKYGLRYKLRTQTMDSDIIDEVHGEYFGWLDALGRKFDTVIDIGSQIGGFATQVAGRLSNYGKVTAFEPEPDNYRLLCENVKLNRLETKVTPIQAAVSDKNGTATLFISSDNTGGNKLGVPEPSSQESIEVRTIDIGQFLAEIPGSIDLVKIDVEGWELPILKQMKPHMNRIQFMIGELQSSAFGTTDDAIHILRDAGFEVETKGNRALLLFLAVRR